MIASQIAGSVHEDLERCRRRADGPGPRPFRFESIAGLPQPPSDEDLVRAHLDGDDRAFPQLVERHQRAVHVLVRRYARGPDEAADMVQKSFLRAFAAAGRVFPGMRLSDEGAFRAWLLRVAANVAKNHARNSRRWRLEILESVE